MKKVFTFFLTLFVASSVWAYDFVVDGIYYDIDEELNSSVSVTFNVDKYGYCIRDYSGSITIPSSVTRGGKTYSVTSIGGGAFADCTGLTSVTIPNSVTSIGESAFHNCSGLTSVTIPNSVTSIGFHAFYRSDLTSVTIGNSVTSIGDEAFNWCDDLKEVINLSSLKIEKGSSDNGYVAYYAHYVYNGGKIVVGDFLFSKNDKILNQYVGSSANVVLPENFEGGSYTIGSNVFANHTEIQSLTIPSSVTSIGKSAFDGCKNLKEVINLSSLKIEKGSSGNGYVAYYAHYVYNGGKIVVGDFLFSKNDKILQQYVGSSANVVLPENFEGGSYTIGSNAFVNHTEIQSVTISSGVTSFESGYNGYNGSLYGAFSGCSGLTSVTIPESLDVSYADIYFTKDGIRYYVLNGKEVAVASNSYTGNIVIPSSVTAGNTFSVTSIGYGAFSGCSGLTSVTIPNSVTSIGSFAFSGCTSLKKVTCLGKTPPSIQSNTFANYNAYLYIPCECKEDYDLHDVWGTFKYIECISSEETELEKDAVAVEPKITEAVFSMPTTTTANSYSLTISNNGVTFCTLTFNNQGQLANIDFSNSQLKAAVEGYQFTVTGLSAATPYNYSFKAQDKNKNVLKEYIGAFTTQNEDGTGGSFTPGATTAIDNVEFANQITIVANQIFVNGEAPAFVITSVGQKIANQNLKAGIYFVQVGNEMQGVAVK